MTMRTPGDITHRTRAGHAPRRAGGSLLVAILLLSSACGSSGGARAEVPHTVPETPAPRADASTTEANHAQTSALMVMLIYQMMEPRPVTESTSWSRDGEGTSRRTEELSPDERTAKREPAITTSGR